MADPGPRAPSRDPFENVISLVAGPIAAVIRSFDQLRRGSDELIKGMENFNRTMQNLNETAERVNNLLNEFEEPVRTVMPQVLRTVILAEELANRVSGPIDQVVPGLSRLADTLSSPVLMELPADLSKFVEAINDLVRRLSPLGQLAESATGLFGLRLPGMPRSAQPPTPGPPAEAPQPSPIEPGPARQAAAPRKQATKASKAKTSRAKMSKAKTSKAKTSKASKAKRSRSKTTRPAPPAASG
jgi:hypothetical protein